jgi:hypothetical protein
VALAGERAPTVGCEFVGTTVNGREDDVPPLLTQIRDGLVTEMLIVTGLTTSEDKIGVVICVELTNVADLDALLKFTVEPLTKFVPLIVNGNSGEPATTMDGTIEEIAGGGRTTAKLDSATPPAGPGVDTRTRTGPAVAIADPGMAAVSCEALMKMVCSVWPPKLIVELEIKLLPFTVSVKEPLPSISLVGEMEVIAGTGFPPLCDPTGEKIDTVLSRLFATAMPARPTSVGEGATNPVVTMNYCFLAESNSIGL